VSDILNCGIPEEWESGWPTGSALPASGWRSPRKASRLAGVTITEALDVALCYGWIDGTRRRHPRW
jgi:hypothetical protein